MARKKRDLIDVQIMSADGKMTPQFQEWADAMLREDPSPPSPKRKRRRKIPKSVLIK